MVPRPEALWDWVMPQLGFFPTGLFDPMTMVLPGVRITKPRGRTLTAVAYGI